MPDNRTRREKLEAMANQTVSPHEAEIARRLLAELDAATPDARPRVEAEADEFLLRVTRTPSGVRVDYDGDPRGPDGRYKPGLIGAMLRAALRGDGAPQVDEGDKLLD